jgi:hypothetical protein
MIVHADSGELDARTVDRAVFGGARFAPAAGMRNVLFVIVGSLAVVTACSGPPGTITSSSDRAQTSSGGPPARSNGGGSICGKPGDTGNPKGIGKYCNGLFDCIGNGEASLCATLGNADAHFCTKPCERGDDAACGDDVKCACNAGGLCGCTPTSCL